ncbi:hypothetical protein, partial [Saccharothrix sp. NRRL B-16348]|uniref:hypothetical protein n=1 Tax=Saccharothrix sp. NRRL B-16348 TaxID=1415542 RepID=UPI001E39F282
MAKRLHTGATFGPHVAAALSGVPVVEARRSLDELASVRLIEQVAHDRYTRHDLLNAYSVERLLQDEPGPDRESATRR